MRILAVQPGADWSTSDVFDGIVPALKRQGVEIVEYRLSARIGYWFEFLSFCWRRTGRKQEKPTASDAVYMAGTGILERALRFDVDWIYIASGMFVALEWMRLIKKAGIKIALHLSESPYDDPTQTQWAEYADVVWTNERVSAEKYGWHYLPHAFDPAKHYPAPIDPELPQHDVVFVGSGFEERVDLLSAVDWTGIDFGLYGNWDGLGSRHRLRKYLRGGVTDNAKVAQLYRNAKIGLNLHRTSMGWGRHSPKIERADSLNPRAYELAACGCFQITDERADVGYVFKGLLPIFTDAEHLRVSIGSYLKNDAKRAELAEQALRLVQSHTFDARARQILGDMEQVRRPILAAV